MSVSSLSPVARCHVQEMVAKPRVGQLLSCLLLRDLVFEVLCLGPWFILS